MAKRWYIIHAYSNFENKVADSIREQVLTKVELTDEAYHLIRNTPKVTGFLGSLRAHRVLVEVPAVGAKRWVDCAWMRSRTLPTGSAGGGTGGGPIRCPWMKSRLHPLMMKRGGSDF